MNILCYQYEADYEWQELDEDFVSENPIQYLVCGTCQAVIDTYQEASFQII